MFRPKSSHQKLYKSHPRNWPNCSNLHRSILDRLENVLSLFCFGWTDPERGYLKMLYCESMPVHVQNLDTHSLFTAARSACFRSVRVEMLHCTRLHSDNFNTYTPAHTNMSWHTYWLLCTKWAYARWNAHAELLWTFPSNVYASTTIKTRQTATVCGIIEILLPLYVGREYVNGS